MAAFSSSRMFSSTFIGAKLQLHNKIRAASTPPNQPLQVRASQGFNDHHEGMRSRRNHEIDDANLRVLKGRVGVMKADWRDFNDQFVEMLMMVCGNFGITIASGTLCLCLASILVHYAA